MSYRDVRPLARAIASATASRAMPPWKAGPSDFPFANARQLTADQIGTIQKWVADGALEGDPARTPPLPRFTEGWQLGPPDLIVTMDEAFEVPARGPDVFRNFVVPLKLDRDRWVRAIDFRPSARGVVHHSLFFLDATGASRERDAADPLPGFPGGMGGGRVVPRVRAAAWRAAVGGRRRRGRRPAARVGGQGSEAGRSVGVHSSCHRAWRSSSPKGSDLILSTHFHPSGTAEREKSTVGLYFASAPPTQAFTSIQLPPVFGVFEGLDIPPDEGHYTIKDSFVIPVDVKAFSVGAHAHYLGKQMQLTATCRTAR